MKKIHEWIIYKITSPSGRVYIGKTINLKNRISGYRFMDKTRKTKLYRSFNKYGFDEHIFTIEDEFQGDDNLSNEKEIFWIGYYKTNICRYPKGIGLNSTDGGRGSTGNKVSEESKKRQSELMKKNLKNTERLRKLNIGVISPKKGMRYDLTDEEKNQKFGSQNLGNSYNKGRKQKREFVEARIKYLTGKPNYVSRKPILQFDLQGNFIKEYVSIRETKKETKLDGSTIHASLNGTTKNPRNFIFKYKNAI